MAGRNSVAIFWTWSRSFPCANWRAEWATLFLQGGPQLGAGILHRCGPFFNKPEVQVQRCQQLSEMVMDFPRQMRPLLLAQGLQAARSGPAIADWFARAASRLATAR